MCTIQKSCDISQLKNVNHYQHSPIGDWQELTG